MIQNDYFSAAFDIRSGTLSVRRSDGTPFLTGGAACANTDAGKRSTASPGREHSVDTAAFRDHLGSGQRLTIDSRDPHKLFDLRVQVDLYDRRSMVAIEVQCTNVSSQDAVVNSLEPIRAIAGERGALRVPGVTACLTNGEMYYNAGTIHSFAVDPPSGLRPPVAGAPLVNESIAAHHPTIASWWNIAFFSGYDRESVVLGYLENTVALGLVLASRTGRNRSDFSPSLSTRRRSRCVPVARSGRTVSC